jgi:hypothetical protein
MIRNLAPAEFLGVQDCGPEFPELPKIELWNLTADIPGHPRGSTLSRETITKAGFVLPIIAMREDIIR